MFINNPAPSGSRFSMLPDDDPGDNTTPKAKRKKSSSNTAYPSLLESITSKNITNPKFIVIKSADIKNPINSYSVFAIHKAIETISSEVQSINILRDGNVLVLVNNERIAEKFIRTKNFGGLCSVTINYHENLNSCKGTIYDRNLIHTSEEEILDGLKKQGVYGVYKFTKNVDNKATPTGLVLLTFNLYKVPQKIKVAWYMVEVREHFPNPMRCKNCQLLGHTMKYCKRNPVCVNCNLPPHNNDPCKREMCANCLLKHPASSRLCQKYQQYKEILKIKTLNKCTLQEARKLYRQFNPINPSGTYSQVVAKNSTPESSKQSQNNDDEDKPQDNSTPINSPEKNQIELQKQNINHKKNEKNLPQSNPITAISNEKNQINQKLQNVNSQHNLTNNINEKIEKSCEKNVNISSQKLSTDCHDNNVTSILNTTLIDKTSTDDIIISSIPESDESDSSMV